MDYPKQRFKTIDHTCRFMSPNCWKAGADICQAYRHAPIHPSHRRRQGFRWMLGRLDHSRYMSFQDNFLCFGLSCAPGKFSRISDVIQRHMHSLGFHCTNYLDDYAIIEDSFERCQLGFLTLLHLLITLGFAISWRKVTGPSQVFTSMDISQHWVISSLSRMMCALISTTSSYCLLSSLLVVGVTCGKILTL